MSGATTRLQFRPGLRSLRVRLVVGFVTVAFLTGAAAIGLVWLAVLVYELGFAPYASPTLNLLFLVAVLVVTVLGLLVLSVGLALLVAGRVLRSVRQLADAAERIARGELSVELPVSGRDELSHLVATFNTMAASLRCHVEQLRKMEAQSRRFVADVSHELRTPLAALTAVVDVLEAASGQMEGEAGAAARLVSRETRNLNRLVDDLIEMSRLDAGTAALKLEDTDVAAAVEGCLNLRGWADQVAVDIPARTVVRVDPRRFDVIVANLVGNALRHGAPPVTIMARILRREARRWLVLEVADRGPGLAPQVLPYIFDRFYKADSARSRSGGSGLASRSQRRTPGCTAAASSRTTAAAAARSSSSGYQSTRTTMVVTVEARL